MQPNLLKLTKDVYFNRSGILLLLVVFVATFFAFMAWKSAGIEKEIFIAIATGLYASTLFSFLQTMLTGLRYEEVVSQSIEASIEKATGKILARADKINAEFLPDTIFPPSDSSSKSFNAQLSLDLSGTKKYFFLGITGRFAIARIAKSKSILEEAHIFVANPFGERSIDHRVRHVTSFIEGTGDYKKTKSKLIAEILQALAASPNAAVKCRKLVFYLTDEQIIDRAELFDTSLYLTLYSDEQKREARFPRTLKFDKSSSMYQILYSQTAREMARAEKVIEVTPETDLSTLSAKLNEMGGDINAKSLEIHKKSFDDFSNKLSLI